MQGTLGDAVEVMLDLTVFKDADMKSSLLDKVGAVLAMIEKDNYMGALKKLENDILSKTDGCAKDGEPDYNDWIITCEAQQQRYPLCIEIIDYVRTRCIKNFSEQWLQSGSDLDADLDNNGHVDFKDFSIFTENW